MISKAMFDFDQFNNPVVKLEITYSPDLRDKVAKQFVEALRHDSQWCEITVIGEGKYSISPIKPEELRDHAEIMMGIADKIARTPIS